MEGLALCRWGESTAGQVFCGKSAPDGRPDPLSKEPRAHREKKDVLFQRLGWLGTRLGVRSSVGAGHSSHGSAPIVRRKTSFFSVLGDWQQEGLTLCRRSPDPLSKEP